MPQFFPHLIFGWTFFAVLVGITAVAAYIDWRRMAIPKWLSVPTLGLGVLFNVVRGAWMALEGYKVWFLDPTESLALGALEGFLFALAGFAVGFGLFFLLWILGTCGGGDVKLCAAVGAWLGPLWTLFFLLMTMICLVFLGLARLVFSLFTDGMAATKKNFYASQGKRVGGTRGGRQGALVPRKRLMTFSLPMCVATALILLIAHRQDLKIGIEFSNTPAIGAQANAK
jgi:prepilin peptidase CpaA